MPHENRFSLFFVQTMLEEAIEIENRIDGFGITEDSFTKSSVPQDLLTAPLLRIGELVNIYLPSMEVLAPDYPRRDLRD